ncbi:MAG: hypothetical protein HYY00_06295 [Chloroflexi bacterium]|nr:hypothetical protein [Chloroflexota bacterium]
MPKARYLQLCNMIEEGIQAPLSEFCQKLQRGEDPEAARAKLQGALSVAVARAIVLAVSNGVEPFSSGELLA